MLTHQPAPPVTQIQQQQASQQASKKQKTVNDAITSSLSSSMNMKRGRNDDGASSEASSSDDSDADTSFKNRIVAPGSKRRHTGVHKRARLSMTSVEASPIEMTVKKRVTFDDKHMAGKSTKASKSAASSILTSAKKFILPTLSQIIGGKKLSPKKKAMEGNEV